MAEEARPNPVEDVRGISAITYGFMASKALFAALEFDLFTHIAQGAHSSGALAKVSGIAENRLIALARRAEVARADQRGRRTSRQRPGDVALSGRRRARRFPRLRPIRERRVRLRELPPSWRGAARRADIPGQGLLRRHRSITPGSAASGSAPRNTRARSAPRGCWPSELDLKGRRKLFGCGRRQRRLQHRVLRRKSRRLKATILDFPETVDTAKRYAREAGLADRIAHLAGNAITRGLAGRPRCRPDVLCLERGRGGRHRRAGEARRSTRFRLAASRSSTTSWSMTRARGRPLPRGISWASMFDNPTAVCLTPGYVERILRDAGFGVEGTETMLPGITMLTRASKPA